MQGRERGRERDTKLLVICFATQGEGFVGAAVVLVSEKRFGRDLQYCCDAFGVIAFDGCRLRTGGTTFTPRPNDTHGTGDGAVALFAPLISCTVART